MNLYDAHQAIMRCLPECDRIQVADDIIKALGSNLSLDGAAHIADISGVGRRVPPPSGSA